MVTLDTRTKLARLIADNPRISVQEMARRTKVTPQRVYQLLEAMGYAQEWRVQPKEGK